MDRLDSERLFEALEQLHRMRQGNPMDEEWLVVAENRIAFEQLLLLRAATCGVLEEKPRNIDVAYQEFKKRYGRNKRNLLPLLSGIAASVIIMICLGIQFLLSPHKDEMKTIMQANSNKISIRIGNETYTIDHLKERQDLVKNIDINDECIACLESGNEPIVMHQVNVPRGEKIRIVLPDGSSVCLNSQSTLFYPSRFEKERLVSIEGEGYFEITPSKIPFIVQSGGLKTEVLGTAFNCCNYETPAVTLIRGKVRLRTFKTSIDLAPGEQGNLKKSGIVNVEKVNIEDVLAWRENKFIFHETNLEEIMNRLQRWYNFSLFWESERTKQYQFDLYGEQDESLEEIINRLNITQRVKISFHNGIVYVADPR